MRNRLFTALAGGMLLLGNLPAPAQEATSALGAQFHELVGKVQARVNDGKTDEKDFADLLQQADDLYAANKTEKPEQLIRVLLLKAQLCQEVFHDFDKAIQVFQQIKKDFPDSQPAHDADALIASLQQEQAADKIQAGLVPGVAFPDFSETNLDGKTFSISGEKGKVVLVDFSATWCMPCMLDFPYVKETYAKYHDKGFDIIGVSLDEDKSKLMTFVKGAGVTWPVYYDGLKFSNKLAVKYGINSIPATYLLDRDGKIIARELRGPAIADAVAKALGQP